MTIQTIATISNSFKTFLQSGNYESAILKLMNESSRVFPHSYGHNDNQSHGECDFISYEGDEKRLVKYDAKLPFDKKEGALICSKKGKVGARKIYVIYPSMDQKLALRCLNNNIREFLPSAEISQHISYEFHVSK